MSKTINRNIDLLQSIFENYKKKYPEILDYYKLMTKKDLYLWTQNKYDLFYPISLNNKKVLDVGCGFGITSILISLMDGKEVYSVDKDKDRIHALIEINNKLKLPIYPKIGYMGDSTLELEENSFDVILATNVIEHLRNTSELLTFYTEAHKFLKIKGFLIIETHNCMNSRKFKKVLKMRDTMEHGPVLDQNGNKLYGIPKSYIDMRKEIIKGKFPYLESNVVNTLAEKTTCMWGEQIINFCKNYIERKNFKERTETIDEISPYCHPIHGESPEYPIFPLVMKKRLENIGFTVKIYPHIGVKRPNRYFRVFATSFPRIFLYFVPSFKIIAENYN